MGWRLRKVLERNRSGTGRLLKKEWMGRNEPGGISLMMRKSRRKKLA